MLTYCNGHSVYLVTRTAIRVLFDGHPFSHKHQSLGYDKNECTSHNDVELVDARTTIRSLLIPKYVDTKVKYMIGVR